MLLVRPSLVCVVDDLEAPDPAEFQWLMHAFEKLDLGEESQTFISRRGGAAMKVHLVTPGGFDFSQTDAWPLDPKTGFPTATRREPRKLWHFTATTRELSAKRRIAAVMVVGTEDRQPDWQVETASPTGVEIRSKSSEADSVVKIDLAVDAAGAGPILEVRCQPAGGEAEVLSVR